MKEISDVYVDSQGRLCKEYRLGKWHKKKVNINPRFDGYDVYGNIHNLNDWSWKDDEDVKNV